MLTKTATSERFSAPARASAFERRNLFRVPQKITCRVLVNTRIRLAERIVVSKENTHFLYQISERRTDN